jgi:hypothetical protein
LTDAAALDPFEVPTVHALAKAHTARWVRDRQAADRAAAEKLARRCIELDPTHGGSFELLNHLEAPRARRNVRIMLAGVVGALLVAGLAVAVALSPDTREAPAPVGRAEQPPGLLKGVFPLPEPETEGPSEAPAGGDALETGVFESAHRVELGTAGAGLVFDLSETRFKRYDTTAFLDLRLRVKNESQDLVKALEAVVDIRGADGALDARERLNILGTHEAPLRPGDVHAVGRTFKAPRTLQGFTVRVRSAERAPGPGPYGDSPPVAVRWTVERPGHARIELRRRMFERRSAFVRFEGEVENLGGAALGRLKVALELLDAGGEVLETVDHWVASTSAPPIRPSEVRLVGRTMTAPEGLADIRVAVLEIE